MRAVEFETEVHGGTLTIPPLLAASLPPHIKARVILLMGNDQDDVDWRQSARQQFLRDDSEADTIYDRIG
jgi:hypothetical protein